MLSNVHQSSCTARACRSQARVPSSLLCSTPRVGSAKRVRVSHITRTYVEERPAAAATPEDETALLASLKPVAFSSKRYVVDFLEEPLRQVFPEALFYEARLTVKTAQLAKGADAVILFVNDDCSAPVVEALAECGVKIIAMRCAGFDRVDLAACEKAGIKVVRVPTYSPQSVAEHAVALMFALNRNLHQSYVRVSQGNYALDGLVGMEMYKKTVGVVGTGAIGIQACRILKGIGCNVLAHDIRPAPAVVDMGIPYMSVEEMFPQCDIISLHCPLLPSTTHIINQERINMMKPDTILINVSRGGLVDSDALFEGLETGHIGGLGMDVYEKEDKLFFQDFTGMNKSQRMSLWDRRFKLLLSYPQVLVTPHSAFLTKEALKNIADTTIANLTDFKLGKPLVNQVKPKV